MAGDVSEQDTVAHENERLAKRRNPRDAAKWLSALAIAAATTGVAGSFSTLLDDKITQEFWGVKPTADARKELNDLTIRQLRLLRADVTALQKSQVEVARLPASDRALIQNETILARMAGVERRQQALEQAILSSPEKALTMPLMRRDIDNMRDTNTQNLAAIKQSVDQIYDLTKWLLGALAVGVLSLAIANFFTKK